MNSTIKRIILTLVTKLYLLLSMISGSFGMDKLEDSHEKNTIEIKLSNTFENVTFLSTTIQLRNDPKNHSIACLPTPFEGEEKKHNHSNIFACCFMSESSKEMIGSFDYNGMMLSPLSLVDNNGCSVQFVGRSFYEDKKEIFLKLFLATEQGVPSNIKFEFMKKYKCAIEVMKNASVESIAKEIWENPFYNKRNCINDQNIYDEILCKLTNKESLQKLNEGQLVPVNSGYGIMFKKNLELSSDEQKRSILDLSHIGLDQSLVLCNSINPTKVINCNFGNNKENLINLLIVHNIEIGLKK